MPGESQWVEVAPTPALRAARVCGTDRPPRLDVDSPSHSRQRLADERALRPSCSASRALRASRALAIPRGIAGAPRCGTRVPLTSLHTNHLAGGCKCGSRTRDKRILGPLLYPSELTCCGSCPARVRYVQSPTHRRDRTPAGTHEPGPQSPWRRHRPPYGTSLSRRTELLFRTRGPETTRPRWAAADRGLGRDHRKGSCTSQPFRNE